MGVNVQRERLPRELAAAARTQFVFLVEEREEKKKKKKTSARY